MGFYFGTILLWHCHCGYEWEIIEPTCIVRDSLTTKCPACGSIIRADTGILFCVNIFSPKAIF